MKLTRASLHAIYGLSFLAGRKPGTLVPLHQISRGSSVPGKHLAKLFRDLVRARILRATPGPRGGFTLARPAREISVLEVIEVFEGPTAGRSCVLERAPCDHVAVCRVGSKLHAARQLMIRALSKLSIREIAQDTRPVRRPTPRRPG